MRIFLRLAILVGLLNGCTSWKPSLGKKSLLSSKWAYSLEDISGKYRASREVLLKDKNSKLLTRLIIKEKSSSQELEKLQAFSLVKNQKLIPVLARYETWLEKKKFSSQVKFSPQTRTYEVTMKSPEAKWNGQRIFKLPSNLYTCFWSQVPECIRANGVMKKLSQDPDLEIDILLIWDNYPYYAEQYVGLNEELFSTASMRIDGLQGNNLRLALDVQGQVIFYLFNKNFDYLNTYWVAQGYQLERNVIKEK